MVIQLAAGFVAATAFAYLYNVPRDQILRAGLVGGLGWSVFLCTTAFWEIGSMLVASVAVALVSESLARYYKQPVVVYLIPGVIPLVPGGKAYLTMLAFLRGDYLGGLELLVSTMFAAGAIAAGIILTSSVFRLYTQAKRAKEEQR